MRENFTRSVLNESAFLWIFLERRRKKSPKDEKNILCINSFDELTKYDFYHRRNTKRIRAGALSRNPSFYVNEGFGAKNRYNNTQ